MHGMPGNPLPEGAPPSAPTDPGSVRADEVLGSLADDLAAEAERSLAEAAVPEPRGTASEGVAAQDDEAARVKAYEASILAAYGGRRGLAEIGLPTMVFVVIYTATSKLTPSLWAAVAVSAVMALWRLVKREKVQNAISGVLGVVVCAVFARHTGQAKDFYLPGVLLNVGEAVLFGVSALVRWPVVGVVLGPITGEMMAWREHPDRLPLYLANQTTALGAAKVLLGYPLYLMVAFMCWQVIRKAPPPARAEA
jgi:hypothetical protein